VFYPWPTERLSIALRRPQPAEGRTLTIDSAHYRIVPGIRQSDASLTLRVRASRAGTQHVELPEGARVRSLTMNGATRPVHNAGRALQFNLQPGSTEVQLAFELESGLDRIYTPAPLVVDAPITNARVSLLPPRDAWLLWLSGPAWGPAILFWGYLVLCLLAAVLLARVRAIPLRRHEWLLLAAGLTQVSSAEAVIVVGFFFAFAWRRRLTELKPLWHDLMQLALVALTLTAASALFDAVRHGLLVQPDMQVAGLTSYSGELVWYEDRTSGALPQVTLVTLPLWVYRALMLLWALWLASRLLRWVPWAFDAFGEGGIWKRRPKRPTPPPPPPAASKTPTTPAQPLG
jgi:ABC-type amino acid transport system permease subunit